MAKYEVELIRTAYVLQRAAVIVEADSEELAEELALEDSLEWETAMLIEPNQPEIEEVTEL